MKRNLPLISQAQSVSVAVWFICGCQPSPLERFERYVNKIVEETLEFERKEIKPLETAVIDLSNDGFDFQAQMNKNKLDDLRQGLAQRWRGQEAEMMSLAQAAKVPQELVGVLRTAQEQAGSLSREHRFQRAIDAGSLTDAAAALPWSEVKYRPEDDDTPSSKNECDSRPVSLACETIASEISPSPVVCLCEESSRSNGRYLIGVDQHQLFVRNFKSSYSGTPKLMRMLSPSCWMMRYECRPKKCVFFSSDRGDDVSATTWFSFWYAEGAIVREEILIAAETNGKQVSFVSADPDSNGYKDTLVVIAPDMVRAVHCDQSQLKPPELWSQERTCQWLKQQPSTPSLASARQQCAAGVSTRL